MELTEFEFAGDHVGLQAAGLYIDLHNNYLFRSHDHSGDRLRMFWTRLDEHWVGADQPNTVELTILGVSYLEIRGELSDCLNEIGFFDAGTLGKVDYNGLTSPTQDYDVLVFRFCGGGEIAVRGQSAKVHMGFE